MAGTYTTVHEDEIRELLEGRGFKEIFIDGTREITYGKIVGKNTCLRVYTSVVPIDGESRGVGEDAIRVSLVYRKKDGTITGIGSDTKVYRIQTWVTNLMKRLDKWETLIGPNCKKCGLPMRKCEGKYGEFWGCIGYPDCRSIDKIQD